MGDERWSRGVAQRARSLPWAPNASPRGADDALRFLRDFGVEVPDDLRIHFVPDHFLPREIDAQYCEVNSFKRYVWSDTDGVICKNKPEMESLARNQGGEAFVPIKVKQAILVSDEAILWVVSHEIFEIQALRNLFDERETIKGSEMGDLIMLGIRGNLHDQAVDHADGLVERLRSARKSKEGSS